MLHRGNETVKVAHDRIQDDIRTFTEIFTPEVEVFDALGDVIIPIIFFFFFLWEQVRLWSMISDGHVTHRTI